MAKRNADVKGAAIQAGVKLWQIAEVLGMTDSSFSRKLRKELSLEMKDRVFSIIKELAEEVSA